jgi:hypothetical protein
MKISRERSSKFDPGHPCGRDCSKESTKGSGTSEAFKARLNSRSIAVYVLPYQMNFFVAQTLEIIDLIDNQIRWSTPLSTLEYGTMQKRAKLIATFDDWKESDVG